MTRNERLWLILMIVVVAGILAGSASWILDHPFGISWDEAQYFNQDQSDIRTLQTEGFRNLARGFLRTDTVRPPAYRVLVIPFTRLLGFSPALARFVSLAGFVITLLLVLLGTSRVAGKPAGAFAVIFLSLAPGVVFPSMMFGTEYSLYLATAGMLYFLFASWNQEKGKPMNWIGLGLALALGALAKTSFALVAGPILLVALFFSWRRIVKGLSPGFILKSVVLAGVIAAPWWYLNFRSAMWLAKYAETYKRHSLGPASQVTWARWLISFAEGSAGLPLTILSVLICLLFIRRPVISREAQNRAQGAAALLCFVCGIPLMLAGMFSINSNLRYVSPSLILFAMGLGILLGRLKGRRLQVAAVSSAALFFVQWAMILIPAIHPAALSQPKSGIIGGRTPDVVMKRWEQWDWNRVREVAKSHGMASPTIAFLGGCSVWNVEQIAYPWFAHNEKAPEVRWLWRYEQGPFEWEKIMQDAELSDIALTAPDFVGTKFDGQDLDNQYNREFVQRLERDDRFEGPIRVRLGRFQPVDILLFVNSRPKRR